MRQPSGWLIVAGGLCAYAVVVVALAWTRSWPELELPWWAALLGPAVVYGGLVFVCGPPASPGRWIATTLSLYALHMALGMLTDATAAGLQSMPGGHGSGGFPPPPLPELLWVPLLLIPLRDVIKGGRAPRQSRARSLDRGSEVDVRAPAVPAPVAPVATPKPTPAAAPPAPRDALVLENAARSRDPGTRQPISENGRVPESRGPARPAVTGPVATGGAPESPRTRPLLDEILARETSAEVARVSFDRVAGQLPAEAFRLPLERMAASLLEPGYLLIPQHLVLGQLGEGLVRVGWKVVGEQFPRHLLAISDQEITEHLPDGQVVLPLDELVSQLPPDIFVAGLGAVDIEGIENFPAPFQPASSEEDEAVSVDQASAPTGTEVGTLTERSTADEWVLQDDQVIEGELDDVEEQGIGPEFGEPSEPAAADSVGTLADSGDHQEAAIVAEPPAALPSDPAARALDGAALSDGPSVAPAVLSGVSPVVATAPEVGAAPAAEWCEADDRDDATAVARRVAALLTPAPFSVEATRMDGRLLLLVSSPAFADEPTREAARPFLPLLHRGRSPWAADQLTLRGPDVALVLTPLDSSGRKGAILVSAVPPSGGLARLEAIALRAATLRASHEPPPDESRSLGVDDRQEPDLIDTEPSTRIRQIAASLDALGPVTARVLRDAEAERDLYLFLPAETDFRGTASFASDLDAAMRLAARAGSVFHAAILRCGGRRLIVRLERSERERSSILVAGGETERPGLAYRQVESVALTLDPR